MASQQLQKIASRASLPVLAVWIALSFLKPLPGTEPRHYAVLFLLLILARALPIAATRERKVTFVASLVFVGTLYTGPWASGALCLVSYLLTALVFRRSAFWPGTLRETAITLATLPAGLLLSALDVALPVQRFSLQILPELTLTALAFLALCVAPSLRAPGRGGTPDFSDARAAVTGEAVAFVGGLLLTALLLALELRQALIGSAVFALSLASTVWVVRAAVELPSLRKRVQAMEYLGIRSIDEPNLDTLPGLLLEAAHGLIQMDRGYVWFVDEDGEHLTLRAAWPRSVPDPCRVHIGEGLAGRVAARSRGIAIGSGDDPRWEREVTLPPGAGDPQSALAIPLRARDRTLGAALFTHRDPGKYTARDVDRIQSIANMVGNALENARLHQEVRHHALRDGMTGLVNHRHLQDILEDEGARALRYNHHISVIMGDVDSFKAYNDAFGHPTGDVLLQRVGEILTKQVRANIDTVARYGGEEFCIVLPETGKAQAARMAERLRGAIAEAGFPGKTADQTVRKTMSFGVACFPEDTLDPALLVKLADAALYRAKRSGKNRVAVADRAISPPGPPPKKY